MKRIHRGFPLIFIVLMQFALSQLSAAADADILIRNARVVDGTGSPWFLSDIAVSDGRITALGRHLDMDASTTIDAAGRVPVYYTHLTLPTKA